MATLPRLACVLMLSLAAVVSGCGSNTPELPPELVEAIAQSGNSESSGDYPSGPYGTRVGDTLQNLCFEDVWLNPKASDFDPAALSQVCFKDFYDPDGSKNIKVLLINTGALWCQACRTEWGGTRSRPSLLEEHDEREAKGFRILGLFFQDAEEKPASEEDIVLWAENFDIDVPFGRDPDFKMGLYADQDVQPFNMLVDTSNMTILDEFEGDQSAVIFAKVDAELE